MDILNFFAANTDEVMVVARVVHEFVLLGAVADAYFGYGALLQKRFELAIDSGFVGGYFFSFEFMEQGWYRRRFVIFFENRQ